MSSFPHIFDQAITAQPCKAGCVKHVHAAHLPSGNSGPDALEIGGGTPKGWTVQGVAPPLERDDLMWFMCNNCDALVSELEVEGHRCAPA